MGLAEKPQMEGSIMESEGNRKWVIAGIPLRAPLRPIYPKPAPAEKAKKQRKEEGEGEGEGEGEEEEEEEEYISTPTGEESRISTRQACPAAPRKRKPAAVRCHGGVVREFFTPPDDLESIFIRRVN
ncbi:cyclin-dependent protein kinase inhibitor SMR6-like [Malania oleifera]|uniref:cyclin-dependent protein kinase inhibitor SMR6-like n=1 Tax=Malania oleifera TaxID=397392 RepID=UPI0025ADE9CD|nr:cyclin-dependent protein kinase inhibitor SMR6-like [Malania oleifera]